MNENIRRYFSPSTNGFYVSNIHKNNKPEDCIEITEEQYSNFMIQISLGKTIRYINNEIIAVDYIEIATEAELYQLLRGKRKNLLDESDLYVLPDRWQYYTEEQKQAWSEYRQALRDLPENVDNIKYPTYPTKPTI